MLARDGHRDGQVKNIMSRLFCGAYLLLVFGVSFPLSAEAVETFGPMHIPIATKGYENLFVALANRTRVDGSTLCSSILRGNKNS